MTDRLSTLLHREAGTVEIPPPPATDVLRRGRAVRRRRRATSVAAAAAAVVVIAGTALVATRGDRGDRAIEPAQVAAFERWGAVAVGSRVFVGDQVVDLGRQVSAMYYTSAGVVVRAGAASLVRADGEVRRLDVDLRDRVPGFEPDSPRFAYAEPAGERRWEVVVHDALADAELARVTVEGDAYGGWTAPPVAIDGDLAWIHLGDHWTSVDWRSGSVAEVPGTADVYEVAGGSYAVWSRRDDTYVVRSMADQHEIGTVGLRRGWYAFLSPDGRHLRSFPNQRDSEDGIEAIVHDVASGAAREVEDPGEDFGWTPGGRMLVVDGDTLSACEVLTGACESRRFDRPPGDLRIGGNPYES